MDHRTRAAVVPDESASELLAQIAASAALPVERAVTLPPAAYRSPELHALELERIFRRDWMCVARAGDVARPGDFLALDLAGEPLVLTRDGEGRLHALSRVCRHRSIDVLAGAPSRCGNATRLTCPYHLWTYRLDGALVGAPEMKGAAGFDRAAFGLRRFRVEEWQGFVFVSLAEAPPPLAPRLARVAELIAPVDLGGWRTAAVVEWGEVAANWKVVVENASECYHHLGTHARTLQEVWPAATIAPQGDADWFWGVLRVSDAAAVGREEGWSIQPTFLPPAPGLSPERRSATLIAGVFPMFFFALSPEFLAWFRWFPTGPESHALDIHVLVPPEAAAAPGYDEGVAGIVEALRAVQAEDAEHCLAVQRGVRSIAASVGRLSPLELPLLMLQRYLARELAAVPGGAAGGAGDPARAALSGASP